MPDDPKTLAEFKGLHEGETIIVCGCGESLSELAHPERYITIGVNDIGRRFHPDYLVVVNPRNQFKNDRFRYVETSQARYLFTQLDLGVPHPQVIKFRLGAYGGTELGDPDVLHYTQNSPYVALCLAAHLGAKRIGLIGVDFTDHHFFGKTGTHALTRHLATIDEQYRRLGQALRVRGIEVFNLSSASRLTAFPKMPVEQFSDWGTGEGAPKKETGLSNPQSAIRNPQLKIVSYATTPVAGVPAILARCINARTLHSARCVWAQNGYGNGVAFTGDIEWQRTPREAEAALAEADVVIVHNGKVAPQHEQLLAGKAIITMAHNYLWNVDQRFVERGFPGVVIGQYQATLPEFDGWQVVPNPLPFWETDFQPGEKPQTVTICYTPSGKHERYPAGHRLYWHAKGYETTMRVLERLAKRYPLHLEVIRDRQVAHAEALAMKRRAHIVIDECVTGSYHRNSLEGLAAGCVVVNGLGLLAGVADVFQRCAAGSQQIPFVPASLDDLEATLGGLIKRGAEVLSQDGARNRQWVEQHWDFTKQWERFWLPVIDLAARRVSSAKVQSQRQATSSATGVSHPAANVAEGVSVVIPFGGKERLPLLEATLSNLRQCPQVKEVIVVEMDQEPVVGEAVRRLADKYVFVCHQGGFHKARAMNLGLAFVERELFLWLDGDLIITADFLEQAITEMRTRQLDCLVPWTSVRYLSATESEQVIQGARCPVDCAPVNVYYSRRGAVGGAVLVRREFARRYGGMCEEFRGWGGEDNAWFHKARLLGRAAITGRNDQHLYHLFHRQSGGYDAQNHLEKNPHYNDNVALLKNTRALTTPASFLARFPSPPHCSETLRRILLFSDQAGFAEQAARTLAEFYGIRAEQLPGNGLQGREVMEAAPPDAISLFVSAAATQTLPPKRLEISIPTKGDLLPMTAAKTTDLNLPEFAAFNDGRDYPRMRRWEMPFALSQLRLGSTMSVLDCTINPVDFGERLHSLYPHTLYRHWQPIQNGQFALPLGVPDQAFDRVVCVNTLEHLFQSQRESLIAEMAHKLKPGGLLILTCDHYFDHFWERPELLRMGVMRADGEEVFNGWNKVTPAELLAVCAKYELHPLSNAFVELTEEDPDLYRNTEPYPHATFGVVFYKTPAPAIPAGKKILLSLLTWNTKDLGLESLEAYLQEAAMLQRLGQEPLIVVCDNGSNDGTQEALRELDQQINLPHRFILNPYNRGNAIARNQIIDVMLAEGGDYLLMMDGDIEIVPFSSYAMLRHMEESGRLLGCLGPHSSGYTPFREKATKYLFSLSDCRLENVNYVAWTQYGLFRREIFEAGIRFEEQEPFDREGWGFEDNDLAFQLHVKGYANQVFSGMTYLHRNVHSSIRVMKTQGIDPRVNYERRRHYILEKWKNAPEIHGDIIRAMRISTCPRAD